MTFREPTLCCFSAPPVSAKTSWAAAVQAYCRQPAQRGSEYCEEHAALDVQRGASTAIRKTMQQCIDELRRSEHSAGMVANWLEETLARLDAACGVQSETEALDGDQVL